jgi:hypothetical protein
MVPVLASLIGIPDRATYVMALDQLHPEPYLINALNAAQMGTSFAANALDCKTKYRAIADIHGKELDRDWRNCVWVEGYGGRAEWDRHASNIGHEDTLYGVRGGFEVPFGEVWSAGAAFSFDDITTKTIIPSKSDGQMFQGAGFVRAVLGPVELSGAVHGAMGSFDVTRYMGLIAPGLRSTGDQDVSTIGGRFEVSVPFVVGPMTLRPVVAAGVVNVKSDAVHETGAGPASLNVHTFDQTFFYINPALSLSAEFDDGSTIIRPHSRIGAMIYPDKRISTTASFQGAPAGIASFKNIADLDKVVFEAKSGVDFVLTDSLSVGFTHEMTMSKHSSSHKGALRAVLEF